jgi:hypothetical protein
MATDKKGFILYADLIHTINQLPSETAGELFKHILKYVNDEHPTTENILVKIAFEPIKQQLKRDLIKFEQIKIKRSDAGKRSAEKRKKQKQQVLTSVKSVEQTLTNPTVIVNDNVNVNDNVINNKSAFSFLDFWNLYDKKTGKTKAEKKYKSISEKNRLKILSHIPAYKLSQPDKQFRKDPTTYLNGEHWNDEVITSGNDIINYNSPIEANPYKNLNK